MGIFLIQVGHTKWPTCVMSVTIFTVNCSVSHSRSVHNKMLSCSLQSNKRCATATTSDLEAENARVRR